MRDTWRLMHWGAGWLVGLFDKRALVDNAQRLRQSGLLQDLLVGAQSEREPDAAVRWIVNRLVEGLPCRQAMIGLTTGEEVDLVSVSGSASFEARSNLLAAAREAMVEALESGQLELHPAEAAADGGPLLPATAIAAYCQEAGSPAAICLPLLHQGRTVGALLLDFDAPQPPAQRDFCQTLAWALAPGLALQRTAARSLTTHGRDSLRSFMEGLLGLHRPGWKLVGIVTLVVLLLAGFVDVDYRVRAPATVEGQVQLASVAPFDGFVSQARARAGDKVHKGDVLARLDDRDLKLEEAKNAAEAELGDRKLRVALARDDAVAIRLAQAEAAQAHAGLNMVREKLARVAITAPFDGVVVKGDLSQQLGAPVEQGKVLFEVASLDAYRVVLRVDERDILNIHEGQTGELLLTGLPGQNFKIGVSRVTPVAQTEDGVNAFRVEASVQGNGERIQPGMEGVGKVLAGERTLLWIWFHRLFNWARYTAWTLSL
jgi:RND family efflux transporter MFP subunit